MFKFRKKNINFHFFHVFYEKNCQFYTQNMYMSKISSRFTSLNTLCYLQLASKNWLTPPGTKYNEREQRVFDKNAN